MEKTTKDNSKALANKSAKVGSELTAEVRQDALRQSILAQMQSISTVSHRGKISLKDTSSVSDAVFEYMTECYNNALFPTFMGLCAFMGFSRQYVYKWIETHPNEDGAEYLNVIRTGIANIVAQQGLSNNANPVLACFILKNSAQGLKSEPNEEINVKIEHKEMSSEEIAKRYADL